MLFSERQGTGPDVVLVHGFLASGKIFEPLTKHLLGHFTVTTIDLPGFAGSIGVPVPPSVEALSELVIDTIRELGIEKCSVLGHSLGAWIALEISLQQPELLARMVLYGGSADGYCPERFESYEASIERIEAQGIAAFSADLAAEWFRHGKQDPNYSVAQAAGLESDQSAAIDHVRTWNSWKARHRLGEVETPALIVCGDSDRSTHPDLSIEMWRNIAGSQLCIFPNAGHAAHLEVPGEFNGLVTRFLGADRGCSPL